MTGIGVHVCAPPACFPRAKAAALPDSSNVFASSEPKSWISVATSPVHPVWWLAPSPAPLSPWKYS